MVSWHQTDDKFKYSQPKIYPIGNMLISYIGRPTDYILLRVKKKKER